MSVLSRRMFAQALSAELDKLIALPSIWITLIGTCIVNFTLAAAWTSLGLQETDGTQNILNAGLASMGYVQAGFIILGILATCSEYAGGQIRTTLTVMPWRGFQLSTKFLALAMITIPAAFIIIGSGMLYSFLMMKDAAVGIEITAVFKTLAGATGYLTFTALLSASLGGVLRRTTPALVILVGYYFIVSPLIRNVLPHIKNVFPDTAGSYMYMPPAAEEFNALTSLQGTGISMIWTLGLVVLAIVFYRKRDA